jgi:hypothetical protein
MNEEKTHAIYFSFRIRPPESLLTMNIVLLYSFRRTKKKLHLKGDADIDVT